MALRRNTTRLALDALTDLTITCDVAFGQYKRLSRRWTMPHKMFVLDVGSYLRVMKERDHDIMRWFDDGGQ
jgi:hypothetical protein